jgi:rhodanese-related sulfurtransferase
MHTVCTACHGSRIEKEYFGKNEAISPDIHKQKYFKCTKCHTAEEMHGDGKDYKNRYEVENGPKCLDCRESKEFKMGHVPDAINIPRGLIEFKIDKKIPDKTTKIVVYCKVGGRGCLSACTLCRMGYKNVMNMAGGWMAWEKAGYPVE